MFIPFLNYAHNIKIYKHLSQKNTMRSNRRAQSAVEFLVTYGWAFIMVLGFIGALFYLDVFNFTAMLPDECEFSSGIDCLEKIVISSSGTGEDDGSVYLMLANNLGASIKIEECYLRVPGYADGDGYLCNDAMGSCGTGDYDVSGERWLQGERMFFNFSQCDTQALGLREGTKRNVYMTIQYHAVESSPEYLHNVTGLIFTRVERPR